MTTTASTRTAVVIKDNCICQAPVSPSCVRVATYQVSIPNKREIFICASHYRKLHPQLERQQQPKKHDRQAVVPRGNVDADEQWPAAHHQVSVGQQLFADAKADQERRDEPNPLAPEPQSLAGNDIAPSESTETTPAPAEAVAGILGDPAFLAALDQLFAGTDSSVGSGGNCDDTTAVAASVSEPELESFIAASNPQEDPTRADRDVTEPPATVVDAEIDDLLADAASSEPELDSLVVASNPHEDPSREFDPIAFDQLLPELPISAYNANSAVTTGTVDLPLTAAPFEDTVKQANEFVPLSIPPTSTSLSMDAGPILDSNLPLVVVLVVKGKTLTARPISTLDGVEANLVYESIAVNGPVSITRDPAVSDNREKRPRGRPPKRKYSTTTTEEISKRKQSTVGTGGIPDEVKNSHMISFRCETSITRTTTSAAVPNQWTVTSDTDDQSEVGGVNLLFDVVSDAYESASSSDVAFRGRRLSAQRRNKRNARKQPMIRKTDVVKNI